MGLRVTRQDNSGLKVAKRTIDAATKAALQDVVEQWHRQYMPRHFTVAGATLYGYQPRKGQDEPALVYSNRGRAVRHGKQGALVRNQKYYWRKWWQKRTHDPLVWSGNSKADAMSGIRVSARAVKADNVIRGVGVLDVERYFYQYDKSKNAPDKADELTRTIPAEEQDLGRYFNMQLGQHLARQTAPAAATTEKVA